MSRLLRWRRTQALAERIGTDEFTFVTNNRADFIHLAGKDLVNTVIEVSLAGDTVQVQNP